MQKRKDELSDSAQKPLWTGGEGKIGIDQVMPATKNAKKHIRKKTSNSITILF